MPNQTVNKVQFGNQTVMDITDTTADAADVIQGEVFYTKSGVRSTGTLGDATQSAHGLMSAADKIKLDSITGNVYTDYTITIAVADWTESNGTYVYTWTNSAITTQCLADVIFVTDPDTVLAGLSLSADKVTGGMQFVCTGTPSGALTVKIRIIDSDTTAIQQNATTTQDGFMTAQDKVKLDAVYQASAYHESDMGIVETTNTATHAISAGQYVIWKGQLYTADSAITVGATLAASGGSKNLTAVSGGGFNALNDKIDSQTATIAVSGSDWLLHSPHEWFDISSRLPSGFTWENCEVIGLYVYSPDAIDNNTFFTLATNFNGSVKKVGIRIADTRYGEIRVVVRKTK